jgi:hypothetical protein
MRFCRNIEYLQIARLFVIRLIFKDWSYAEL